MRRLKGCFMTVWYPAIPLRSKIWWLSSTITWYAKDTASPESAPRNTQALNSLVREVHNPWPAKHTGFSTPDTRITRLKALLIKHLNPKALLNIKQLLQQHLEDLSTADTTDPKSDG